MHIVKPVILESFKRIFQNSHLKKIERVKKSNQIIKDLMDNKMLYKEMAKKEGKVWGKVFTDDKRVLAIESDQEAAKMLGLNRNKFSLAQVLQKHAFNPKNGLSLACGSGRAERGLMQAGICDSFHAIDISDTALTEARQLAKKQQFNITYEQADLNELKLDHKSYDLVVTQNCLHHVLRLEDLAEKIHLSLRPAGLLWVHDYIGETQFQYEDERLEIVNKILSILPEKYRVDSVNKRVISKIIRRMPGTLISPFEAIRSAEIMPVFLEYFEVIEKCESASILSLVCPVGTRVNYVKSEEDKLVFELLLMFDQLLINKKTCTPHEGIYLLRAK
jgi:2-polyprenyl-3-methyl-5-hydroxy-6-metoxy-1,4-benzoquinol methylase